MNDTTRELGSALGVAVIGSVMSSFYGPQVLHALPATLPGPARDAAADSVGAAAGVASQLGGAGGAVLDAAREAFVYAMARASWVAAAVGLVGAFIAWRWLPARAAEAVPGDDWDDESLAELDAAYGPLESAGHGRHGDGHDGRVPVVVDGDDFVAALHSVR
jgi:hypothetical protein